MARLSLAVAAPAALVIGGLAYLHQPLRRGCMTGQKLVAASSQLLSYSGEPLAELTTWGKAISVPSLHVVSDPGPGGLAGTGLGYLSHGVGEAGLPQELRAGPASPPSAASLAAASACSFHLTPTCAGVYRTVSLFPRSPRPSTLAITAFARAWAWPHDYAGSSSPLSRNPRRWCTPVRPPPSLEGDVPPGGLRRLPRQIPSY